MSDFLSDASGGSREFDADPNKVPGPDGQHGLPPDEVDPEDDGARPDDVPDAEWPDVLAALQRQPDSHLPALGRCPPISVFGPYRDTLKPLIPHLSPLLLVFLDADFLHHAPTAMEEVADAK